MNGWSGENVLSPVEVVCDPDQEIVLLTLIGKSVKRTLKKRKLVTLIPVQVIFFFMFSTKILND